MKSFFKKLSLVLAAAMVITMLPLQGAKAATAITVGLSGDSKNPNPSAVTLNVGDTQSWKFTGVDKYNAAGAATKKWNSSDPTVVSVNNGAIKALKAGTAKITLQLTNNGIQYAGTTTVTVVDPKAAGSQTAGNVTVKQVSYNSIEIEFADAAAAKAAKDKVVVERIKNSAKGEFYLNVNATPAVSDNKLTISGLADQISYRITVPGVDKKFVVAMSVGEAAALILEYPTVYIGTGVDILNNNIKNPTVTPAAKVVDEKGIVVNFDKKNIKYVTDKTRNSYATFTAGTGKIKFSSASGSCYVKASYSFKDKAGVNQTLTDEITVTPVTYVAPNLQGFVEQICLTDKKGKDIVYPGNYTFKETLSIGTEKQIAYYFESTDGKLYTGNNVKTTVEKDGIAVMNPTDYVFYFRKDNDKATAVSLQTAGNQVSVKGWNEGTEMICLYQKVGKEEDPKVDTLVGVLEITVQPEPYVMDMHLSEDSLEGLINGLTTTAKVTYELESQYNEAIPGTLVLSDVNGGNVSSWATVTKKSGSENKGEIEINFTALGVVENKELVVTVKGQKDPEYSETITIVTEKIDNTSSDVSYELVITDSKVNDASLKDATTLGKIGANIKVAKLYDGYRYEYVPFAVVSNKDADNMSNIDTITPSAANLLYVVITDVDDKVVEKDATSGAKFATSGSAAYTSLAGYVATGSDGFTFDGLAGVGNDCTGSQINDIILTGTYAVTLFRTTGTTAGAVDQENSAEMNLTNEAKYIQNVNNTYTLTIDNKATKATETKTNTNLSADLASDTQVKALLATIVGNLYGWIDKDSDGEAETGEVNALSTLASGFTVVPEESKWVVGAEGKKEIFVKTVDIKYTLGGIKVEQTITVNRKFEVK